MSPHSLLAAAEFFSLCISHLLLSLDPSFVTSLLLSAELARCPHSSTRKAGSRHSVKGGPSTERVRCCQCPHTCSRSAGAGPRGRGTSGSTFTPGRLSLRGSKYLARKFACHWESDLLTHSYLPLFSLDLFRPVLCGYQSL